MSAAEAREIAAQLPEGSGLRRALLNTAERAERGDTRPVVLSIIDPPEPGWSDNWAARVGESLRELHRRLGGDGVGRMLDMDDEPMITRMAREVAKREDNAFVMGCLAAGRQLAAETVAKTDQPPLDEDERALVDVGISAGIAAVLMALEQRGQ